MWKSHDFAKSLQDGFRKTGIYPMSPDVIRSKVYQEPTGPDSPSNAAEKSAFLDVHTTFMAFVGPHYGLTTDEIRSLQENMKESIDSEHLV